MSQWLTYRPDDLADNLAAFVHNDNVDTCTSTVCGDTDDDGTPSPFGDGPKAHRATVSD